MKVAATLTVNGVDYPVELDPGTSLLGAVRESVGLTGSKEGCDDSECGACMMLLDGRPVNACSYLALQAEGRAITTVEGLATRPGSAPAPARVSRGERCAMRLLHPGHAHLRHSASPRQPDPERGGSSNRALRQPLPLHGVRRHRESRAEGRRRRRTHEVSLRPSSRRLTARRAGGGAGPPENTHRGDVPAVNPPTAPGRRSPPRPHAPARPGGKRRRDVPRRSARWGSRSGSAPCRRRF